MTNSVLLPDPNLLSLVDIEVDKRMKMISAFAITTSLEAKCPLCQQSSGKVQSYYTRTLADLPCFGQTVRWFVQVRRIFCLNTACERKVFTERLPTCAPAYARRVVRQADALCEMAFALGGKAGEALAYLLAMAVSHDTLLRLIRRSDDSPAPTPRILGVDDFAWKKGNRYGTILVDLERHTVIDVLPDREKKTFEDWLKTHPGVEVVSRDRASSYADAAREGAPQAVQVADHFHLLLNLRENLKSFLDQKRISLPKVEIDQPLKRFDGHQTSTEAVEALAVLMKPLVNAQEQLPEQDATIVSFVRDMKREKWFHAPSQPDLAQSQVNRTRRLALYEEVRRLHTCGVSQLAIAHTLGISRPTVQRFVQAESFPEQTPRPRKTPKGKLDPFVPFILKHWQEGEYNGAQIYREIQEQGYAGSPSLLALFLADLRRMYPPALGTQRTWIRKDRPVIEDPTFGNPPASPAPKKKRLTPSQVAWLFVCQPEKLTKRQQKQVEIVCQAGTDLQQVYEWAQDFVRMVAERKAENFDPWLQRVEQSAIPALKGFAKGLRRDDAAVIAGLTLPWSQGQTEGQVHRLKLIKRQAYGRASFDLLRLRVLHGSGRNQQKCV